MNEEIVSNYYLVIHFNPSKSLILAIDSHIMWDRPIAFALRALSTSEWHCNQVDQGATDALFLISGAFTATAGNL